MVDASRECMRVRRPALGSLPRHDPNRWTAIVLPKDVVGTVHSNFEAFASGSPILQVNIVSRSGPSRESAWECLHNEL